MIPAKLEVLVDLGADPDSRIVEKTLNQLKSQDEVKEAKFTNGAFMIETTLPSTTVLDMVARTSGKRAVLQGFGEAQSAVAMIASYACRNSQVLGVIRFQQCEDGPLLADGSIDGLPPGQHGLHVRTTGDLSQQCEDGPLLADGSIDGLTPGQHGLHVRTTGDLSQGCDSLGDHYNPRGTQHGGPTDCPDCRHAGDLGNICADETGRATFRLIDDVLCMEEIIGRSVAVTERADDLGKGCSETSQIDGDSGKPVACGVIARSAGIFQNPKRICLCDGVVVWDERDRPLAGKGRRQGGCCQDHDDSSKVEVKVKQGCCPDKEDSPKVDLKVKKSCGPCPDEDIVPKVEIKIPDECKCK